MEKIFNSNITRGLVKPFSIIIFMILLLNIRPVHAQNNDTISKLDSSFFITGKVYDQYFKSSMTYVHIINLSNNRATLSDRKGNFMIRANWDDTLYFSHIGYKKKLLRLYRLPGDTSKHVSVALVQDTIYLQNFKLIAPGKLHEFRREFINLKVPEDTLNPAFVEFVKEDYFVTPELSITIPGPITILYDNFNRKARLERRIQKNRSRYYDNLPEEEKRKVLFYDE